MKKAPALLPDEQPSNGFRNALRPSSRSQYHSPSPSSSPSSSPSPEKKKIRVETPEQKKKWGTYETPRGDIKNLNRSSTQTHLELRRMNESNINRYSSGKLWCQQCMQYKECDSYYYMDWLRMHHRDDSGLQYVCREKWRKVLHDEYLLLSTFVRYKKRRDNNMLSRNYSIQQEEHKIPECVLTSMELFIDEELDKQCNRWQREWKERLSYCDAIRQDFERQIKDSGNPRMVFEAWLKGRWTPGVVALPWN